jgi:hypothetical protein
MYQIMLILEEQVNTMGCELNTKMILNNLNEFEKWKWI